MDIYKRLDPQPSDNRDIDLSVPRYIHFVQKCVALRIQDIVIARTHFTDLYVLILSMDIENLKSAIRRLREAKDKRRGRNVRDISQSDAVKFLKGGL